MALTLGPIVGAVTDTIAKIWFQSDSDSPGRYACHVFDEDTQQEVPHSPWLREPREEDGYTTTVEVELPTADHRYSYEIHDPQGVKIGPLSFRTFPSAETQPNFTFAFASCHKPFAYEDLQERYRMWDQMGSVFGENDVRFLLMIGDQVYAADASTVTVEEYRQVYQKYWGHQAVMKVLGRYPTYMIWDDHEIRNGWGSKEGDSNMDPRFVAARKVYQEFQGCHNPSPLRPDNLYYAFQFGQVGFLVLDLRGHRDLSREDRPLLDAQQWEDTKDWLTKQNLRVLFIVCSVPLVHVPPGWAEDLLGVLTTSFKDHWSYWRVRPEQRELVQLLFKVANDKDQQILVLGGNVHVGTTAKIQSRASDRVIYQFTSSPVANEPVNLPTYGLIRAMGSEVEIDEEISGRVLERFRKRNFGLVHVNYDASADSYRVVFELYREGKSPYTFST